MNKNPRLSRVTKFLAIALAAALAVSADRPTHAENNAIPVEVQSSVDRGLQWLARTQESNGSWNSSGGMGGPATAAVTGLSAMAFMARGHVPGQGPYGENLNRAIDAILAMQQKGGEFDGLLATNTRGSHPMYEHGICTVALCEAFGMLDDARQERARSAISRGVKLILQAQDVSKSGDQAGGWRYQPNSTDSDLSVTGWQLMALRGAANIGSNIPKRAIDLGIQYVTLRAARGSGGFVYMGASGPRGASPNAALTGTGILALALLGNPNAPEVKAGGDFLLHTPIVGKGRPPSHYFYTVYYCSQAAWQLGGRYWENINREISTDLLQRQRSNGSWPLVSDGEDEGGDNYCTAMAILSLTVPYRYLPIYQR